MIKYWSVVSENDYTMYQGWENPVGGSLTPADEIDGKTPRQAVKVLAQMFDRVRLHESKYYPTITCRKEGVTG